MMQTGYIALHRAIFEHPLFRDERPFTRLQAFAYLIADAAWTTSQRRVGKKVVTLERGQLAVTLRPLGKTWGWTEAKVRRFLDRLKVEGMIRTLVTDAATDAVTDAPKRSQVTIVTVCNYAKFNDPSTATKVGPTQSPTHQPTRRGQQALDLGDEKPAQPLNHLTKESKKADFVDKIGEKKSGAPRHGQQSAKHGTIFIAKGSEEWGVYAKDYQDARGAEPLPDRHGGFWFCTLGEAYRMQRGPQKLRRRA